MLLTDTLLWHADRCYQFQGQTFNYVLIRALVKANGEIPWNDQLLLMYDPGPLHLSSSKIDDRSTLICRAIDDLNLELKQKLKMNFTPIHRRKNKFIKFDKQIILST